MRKEFFIKKPPSPRLRRSGNKDQKISCVLYSKNGKINKDLPVVIYCHGFTGYKEEHWYPKFFSMFPKHGYQLLSFDMYAHGQSYGHFIDITMTKVLDDYKTVYDYVAKRGLKRIALAGHSFGGAASILMANKCNIQGLILISSVTDRFFQKRLHFSDKIKVEFVKYFGFLPQINLERGKVFLIGRSFFTDFEKHKIRKEAGEIKKPILLIHAEKDRSIPLKEGKELYKSFNFDITDFQIIKGADHCFKASKYHNQVITNFFRWTDLYLKKKVDHGVIVYLRRPDGKVLLLKRSNKVGFYPLLWSGTGGFLPPGENARERAFVEVGEETGLKKNKLKYVRETMWFKWEDKNYDRVWRIKWFLFDVDKTKIKKDWETSEYRWIKPENIIEYKTLPHQEYGLKKLKLI